MDVVLGLADKYFFTPYVYPETWEESNPWRQFLSLNIVTDLGGAILYLITASLSYLFIFDHNLLKHPQVLEVSISL